MVIVIVLGGCGRYGFDLHGDGGPPDACVLGAWTTPVPLTVLNAAGATNDTSPDLSADGLTLVFDSGRNGEQDLFLSRRTAIGQPWQPPTFQAQASSVTDHDLGGQLSADGLTLYFTSARTGAERLHRATRASIADEFGAATLVPELAGENVLAPGLSSDDTEVIFTSYGMNRDLRRARLAGGVFESLEDVAELNTAGDEGEASLSADSLTMYFESDRSGDVEIYQVTRPSTMSAFGAPVIVTELSGPGGSWDSNPAISTDGTELYFASNRPGSSALDLYVSTRSCL